LQTLPQIRAKSGTAAATLGIHAGNKKAGHHRRHWGSNLEILLRVGFHNVDDEISEFHKIKSAVDYDVLKRPIFFQVAVIAIELLSKANVYRIGNKLPHHEGRVAQPPSAVRAAMQTLWPQF